jgi:hypothetical protein
MRFFETADNAIVIAYDDKPVLTTDPWINADAYFGSWAHDYEIAPLQIQAIRMRSTTGSRTATPTI